MSSNNKLELGQVVRLKSGGPRMTITYDQGDNSYTCTWFLAGKPQMAVFNANALIPAPRPTEDEDAHEDEYE